MTAFVFRNPAVIRRLGRAIVIGMSVFAILVAVTLWSVVQRGNTEIQSLQATIATARMIAARPASEAAAVSTYQSETSQLAQAQLQSDMQALANAHDLQLEVIRADQITPNAGLLELGLTLNGVMPEPQLGAFLLALTQHQPTVVVDSINLRRARSMTQGVDDRLLSIQLELVGFTGP